MKTPQLAICRGRHDSRRRLPEQQRQRRAAKKRGWSAGRRGLSNGGDRPLLQLRSAATMSEVRIAIEDIILERTFEFELRGDVIIQHPRCRVQLTNVYVRNQTLSHEHSVDAARIA